MSIKCKGVFVIGAKRTPFCNYGGPLRELPASHAFAAAAKAAITSANLDASLIDSTVVGNVNFLSQCDGGKTPRYCGIYSGVPIERPALGVNKACGTGLQSIITGTVDILIGSSKINLTGGTEIMSTLPMLVRNVRFGTTLGVPYQIEDHIKKIFPDSYSGLTLQKMAEDVTKKYGLSRNEVDQFALNSHLRWKTAQDSKIFERELTSMTVNIKKKQILVDKDEVPNPKITIDELSQLPCSNGDGDVVTSGNTSVPADGAAAIIVASERSVKDYSLEPLARITGWACVGVDPVETGTAAIPAIKKLLDSQGLSVNDVDLFEINETFASQALACAKELKINLNKVNVNGGALSIGHPVSATGARMATHLVHELNRCNFKRAVAASTCGGGQGVAVMFESV